MNKKEFEEHTGESLEDMGLEEHFEEIETLETCSCIKPKPKRDKKMKSTIQNCPRCIKHRSEGYKQGYHEASNMFQKEIEKAHLGAPIKMVIDGKAALCFDKKNNLREAVGIGLAILERLSSNGGDMNEEVRVKYKKRLERILNGN